MRINEDVLRYLTLRVDQLEEAPSPVMQSRGSREDRPRRDRDRYGEGRDRYEPRESSEAIPERAVERPSAESPAAEPPAAEPPGSEGEPAPSEKVEA
jgi:hypothetical protein